MGGYETIHSIIDIDNKEKQPWNVNGSCSIFRVPKCMRQGDENAYVPQIVSIGPFHSSNNSLQAMNNNKNRYLLDVISWSLNNGRDSQSQREILGKYLEAVESVEKKARACYSEPINLDSKKFVEMMVIDGCFIIGLLCKLYKLIRFHHEDPIFDVNWLWRMLQKDLLMLENQIPFIVLQKLFDQIMVLKNHECTSLASLAHNFFKGLVPNIEMSKKKPKHLLHFFQSSLVPMVQEDEPAEEKDRKANNFDLIQSVKALKEAGIKFKKAKEAKSFFDVKFKKGTLEIPPVVIDESTNSLFLNLVAFEQCYSDCTNYFTDYTAFMYRMINSNTDVRTLCKKGIIENRLWKEDEVANLFKILGDAATVSTDKFSLSKMFSDITKYENDRSTCSKCMMSLKRFYFNSFLSIFPFGAAIILLVLTFIQTYCAMYSYLHPSPK